MTRLEKITNLIYHVLDVNIQGKNIDDLKHIVDELKIALVSWITVGASGCSTIEFFDRIEHIDERIHSITQLLDTKLEVKNEHFQGRNYGRIEEASSVD